VNVSVRALAAAAVAASGLALAAPAQAAAPTSVTGGQVKIDLNDHSLQAVRGHGIRFAPVGTATLRNGNLRLPVTGGTHGRTDKVDLGGGFEYGKSGHTVKITHIVMNTATHRARADVSGHGKIDVFVLGDPQEGGGSPNSLSYGDYPVKLTAVLTRAVDHALSTAVVGNNPKFGTGFTSLRF
jgi:hypothetical protein